MTTLNIRDIDDPFERYQMPELEIRTKNGITYLVNAELLAKALHTQPEYMAKYFSQTLGTMSKMKKAELQINGNFTKPDLLEHLRGFIKKCLLCPECDLPELEYVAKKSSLKSKCQACGHKVKLDLDDKLFKAIHLHELAGKKKKNNK